MNTFSDLFRYLAIYRRYIGRRMYIVFVLSGAAALASGFGITLLLPLLRASQTGASEDMGTAEQLLFDALAWLGIADSMGGILGFIAVVFVGKGMLTFVQGGYQGYLQAQLLRELKGQLFDAYSGMEYRYYIRENTGHFINVINGQVSRFFESFGRFAQFLTQILTTVAYFAFAIVITWQFTLLALGIGGIILFLFKFLNTYVRDLSRKQSQEMSHLNKLLVQTLQAFKYVVSTNQTSHLRGRIMESIRRVTGYTFRQKVASSFTGAIKEPASVLLLVGIIALQVVVFQEPIAPIFVALLLFHRGMQAVISIQGNWQYTMDDIGSVEMVSNEFNTILAHQERRAGTPIGPLAQSIEFHDVHFAYNAEDGDVLHGIDVQIPAKSTVALVGESGAGKSTLVDMLTLMLPPDEGMLRIDGVPHTDIDLNVWRSQIGYVSQETVVFDDTIANNIALWQADGPETWAEIEDAARRAYAHNFIKDLPNGYDTIVGERGVRLSGGQRQRLFIARELFKEPNLLILDEATSALDTESERYIQDSIDALKGEMTVVIIAHRLSTIKNVDYVYVLDEGRVVEEGPYEDLRRENGRFQRMVEMQSL